jgi:copper resistance protein C
MIEVRRIARVRAGLLMGMLLLVPAVALAHAILVRSFPAKHQVVDGKDVAFDFHFNARIDGARSTLTLVTPDGKRTELTLLAQPSLDSLAAHASKLAPGEYTVHWQVLSSDGHITSGDVPFTVRQSKE